MSARDFINETLLPKLERELADEAKGNKHYLAGFERCAESDIGFHRVSAGRMGCQRKERPKRQYSLISVLRHSHYYANRGLLELRYSRECKQIVVRSGMHRKFVVPRG
jgi:hypothetical protein